MGSEEIERLEGRCKECCALRNKDTTIRSYREEGEHYKKKSTQLQQQLADLKMTIEEKNDDIDMKYEQIKDLKENNYVVSKDVGVEEIGKMLIETELVDGEFVDDISQAVLDRLKEKGAR